MKRMIIAIIAIGLMLSCAKKTETAQKKIPAEVEVLNDGHNVRNSLDYTGIYAGKLPTASGEGMIVIIELGDSTFTRKTEYIGRNNKPIEETGGYTWNSEGNTIILKGDEGSPNQYFVRENILMQLDMDGNKITGEMASNYILIKQ